MLMNNETQENIDMKLSPDNIYGYIFTTQGYSEDQDDKRKKPLFFWKGFHMYPLVVQNPEDYDFEDPDFDATELEFLVCTEGGDQDNYEYVEMNATELRDFLRAHPAFRMFPAADLFEDLHVI